MTFHVRRKDKEITDKALLNKILRTSKFVTIAFCLDNVPYLVSLSHGYDEKRNCLYFHCASEGKKLVYLKANNVVWGQALLDFGPSEEDDCSQLYASVHFSGKVTLIEDLDEKRRAIQCMINQLGKHPEVLVAKLNPDRLKITVLGRIDIDYISGKKAKEVTV